MAPDAHVKNWVSPCLWISLGFFTIMWFLEWRFQKMDIGLVATPNLFLIWPLPTRVEWIQSDENGKYLHYTAKDWSRGRKQRKKPPPLASQHTFLRRGEKWRSYLKLKASTSFIESILVCLSIKENLSPQGASKRKLSRVPLYYFLMCEHQKRERTSVSYTLHIVPVALPVLEKERKTKKNCGALSSATRYGQANVSRRIQSEWAIQCFFLSFARFFQVKMIFSHPTAHATLHSRQNTYIHVSKRLKKGVIVFLFLLSSQVPLKLKWQ